MCGLGFNGFDAKGKAKWDGITNVNILKVEVLTPNCLMQFSMEACYTFISLLATHSLFIGGLFAGFNCAS